ncbi:hypothetical protein OAK65_03785 [Synechococcus sp. AH-551-N17]|nr:hypothetical protein [Synechococcus sp. AH-551-N17]
MCTEINNSFQLEEDEEELEYLRRQQEANGVEGEAEDDDIPQQADAYDDEPEAFTSFAFDDDNAYTALGFDARVVTRLQLLHDCLHELNNYHRERDNVYLPSYESGRMRKEIILTHIYYTEDSKEEVGTLAADRTGCPVVDIEFGATENGYDFDLDPDIVTSFTELGWTFVILKPRQLDDYFMQKPWHWATQLKNQLIKAGAKEVRALPLKGIEPHLQLIPNAFTFDDLDLDCILSEDLYIGELPWRYNSCEYRNLSEQFPEHAKDAPIGVDIQSVAWDEFKFMRQEQLILESREFPAEHSRGIPELTAKNPMMQSFEMADTVKLKAVASSHGSRKTQSAKEDFDLRVKKNGGCAITITPLRSVNSSIHQLFGGQLRDDLRHLGTLKTEEALTKYFLTGTDKQRHSIICVESITHKSAIGLKISELRYAWQQLKETTGSAPTIDVIIDEVPIVIDRMLDGGTVKNPGLTIDAFTDLLQFAVMTGGRISMMSADLSIKEHNLIGGLLRLTSDDWKDPEVVACINGGIRTGLANKRSISLSTNVEACKERLFAAIDEAKANKQCVFLASNKIKPSSTSTGTLTELIKVHCGAETRVLELNSRTVIDVKHSAHAFINAPEHDQMLLLKDVDVVVATSVVEAGVSWDSRLFPDVPDNLIHSIFCIDIDGRWSASGKLQAINRWRNPAVPAEICTTDRRMCDKSYVFEDDFDVEKITRTLIRDRDAFTMMIMGIFRGRQFEHPLWVRALAQKISQEQLQLSNPLAAVSAVAKSMGHTVALINDSAFGVQKKIEGQTLAKLVTRRLRSLRSAVTARAISIEGARRVEIAQTTLTYERIRLAAVTEQAAGGSGLAALAVGIAELKDRNYRLAQKGNQPTTVSGLQAKQDRIDNYEFLEEGNRLTLQAFLMVEAAGFSSEELGKKRTHGLNVMQAVQMAKMFLEDVAVGTENLLPVMGKDELKKLSKSQNKTDQTQMLLERLAVMEEFCLDSELTAPGVELPPHEWMDLTYTQIPKLLHKRFVIEADPQTIEQVNNVALFDVPVDTSTGRVLEVARSIRAAAQGVATGLFEKFTQFEKVFGTTVQLDDLEGFVRSALVRSDWLTQTDVEEINRGWSKCCKWIATNIDRIDSNSYGHSFLLSDGKEVKQLAEMIHSNRTAYAAVITNAHGCIERANKASNHFNYLKKICEEVSLYSLTTIGDVSVKGKMKKLAVMIRKQDLPTNIECQRLYQRWLETMRSSHEHLHSYMIFEQSSFDEGNGDSTDFKQPISQLSRKPRAEMQALGRKEFKRKVFDKPEYKKRPVGAKKFNLLSFDRTRRRII